MTHIQRAFRERKKRNLGRAAKVALLHAASGKKAKENRRGEPGAAAGGDVRVDIGEDARGRASSGSGDASRVVYDSRSNT